MRVVDRPHHPFLHDLGKADDRVERGAQLMAHRAEEFRFRAAGGIGLLLGLTQGGLVADPLANVAHDADHLGCAGFRIVRACQARLDPNIGAVFAPSAIGDRSVLGIFQPPQHFADSRQVFRVDDFLGRHHQRLLGFITVEAAASRRDIGPPLITRIEPDDHVERALGELSEAPLAFERLALGTAAPAQLGEVSHAQHRQCGA